MLVYLDQNVVGYIYEGRLSLGQSDDIQWVYSNEHFTEIARGEKRGLISVFEELRARQLEVVLDNNFMITDQAHLHEYSDPFEKFRVYLETMGDVPIDQTPALDFMARLFGGGDLEAAKSAPNRMDQQLHAILDGIGPLGDPLFEKWSSTKVDLTRMIAKHLGTIRSLEAMRKPLGMAKGRASNSEAQDDPIAALWRTLEPNLPGITIDQFFGFDPIDRQGYDAWPLYLGIVGCHTVLNFLGFRPDKGLSSASTLPNILSDGSHIAHAAFCNAVVSEDRRFCSKARAIYRHSGILTEVVEVAVGANHALQPTRPASDSLDD